MKNKILKTVCTVLALITALCLVPYARALTVYGQKCGCYTYTDYGGTGMITDYSGPSAEVLEIPSTLNGCVVTGIGSNAFKDHHDFTRVVIPDTVKTLSSTAFNNCSALRDIVLPDSVTLIYDNAFKDCPAIENLYIDSLESWCSMQHGLNNPMSLSKNLYVDGVKTVSIKIPDGVEEITAYSFCGVSWLTDIDLNNVKVIGGNAFGLCTGLKSVGIPDSVERIEEFAFYKCTSLESVTLSKNMGNIPISCFDGCSALKSIEVPEGVTKLWYNSFKNCTSLESVTLPSSVTAVGANAFSGCSSLKGVSYGGAKLQADAIHYDSGNDSLLGAEWTYAGCKPGSHAYEYACSESCSLCGELREVSHSFDNACDTECNVCSATRTVSHSYTNDCDTDCNLCDYIRVTEHKYDSACDTECNVCFATRTVSHSYTNDCDADCNLCNYIRIPYDHQYKNACDTDCNVCGHVRSTEHTYSGACDIFCDVCGDIRRVTHQFENDCDADCGLCGFKRTTEHKYSDACDAVCDVCGQTRTVKHTYDNSCDPDCSNCGAKRTVTHTYDNACDAACNVCYAVRFSKDGAPHRYDDIYDAVCNICGHVRTAEQKKVFFDVPTGSWYKKYVDYAVAKGIFKGTGEGAFSPNTDMTRAQLVMIFSNLAGVDTSDRQVNAGFLDVPRGKWYTGAVAWAAKNGIVSGMGDGMFAPDARVTREQMCVMLVNYVEKYSGATLRQMAESAPFADNDGISVWARSAVYKCADAKLVNGVGGGRFDPRSSATRAQGATLFSNFYKEYLS